jgi:hypothetical protein
MLPVEEIPSEYNQASHLSHDEKRRPYLVFEQIFVDHRLGELKKCLDDAREICLTTDDPPFCEADSRVDLIIFFKDITRCIEAACIIANMIKLFDIVADEASPQ